MSDAQIASVGIILAGGRARRMGGLDKAFVELGGQTLIERAVARALPQVDELVINANGDLHRLAQFGVPVIADRFPEYLGPLAGILAGLEWVRANYPQARWMVSFACDCPFFPRNLAGKLIEKAEDVRAEVAIATSGERHHPVFAAWWMGMAGTSQSVLKEDGIRKMDDWIARFPRVRVAFPADPIDPFFNINTADDLKQAEALMAGQRAIE